MFKLAVPILGVSKSAEAEKFYCEKLGFRRRNAYRPDPDNLDPCWMRIVRDDVHLVISSFTPDGPPGSRGVQIFVDDIGALREQFTKAGVKSMGDILDQEWGTFDMDVTDPDGNHIGFSQAKGS